MSNNKKFGINLEFTERIQFEDHISDVHLFSIYKTINIDPNFFKNTFKKIREDFLKLLDTY